MAAWDSKEERDGTLAAAPISQRGRGGRRGRAVNTGAGRARLIKFSSRLRGDELTVPGEAKQSRQSSNEENGTAAGRRLWGE